jgi:alpha-L-rhamnosidase
MNSFDHHSDGAIAEWIYEHVAGLAKDPENPGFKHFFPQPKPGLTGRITRAVGTFISPYVRSSASGACGLDGSATRWWCANTTATLRIPGINPSAVSDGRHRLVQVPGWSCSAMRMALPPSGSYREATP